MSSNDQTFQQKATGSSPIDSVAFVASMEDEIARESSSKPQEKSVTSQAKLNNLIKRLYEYNEALNETSAEHYIAELQEVYANNDFRHLYSEITRILLDCYDNEDKQHTLTVNFQRLHELIENDFKSDDSSCTDEEKANRANLKKGFAKLYDHFNLEIARLRYIDGMKNYYTTQLTAADTKIEKYKKQIEDFQAKLDESTADYNQKINEKFNDASTQSMTILGIFSAIVFAFTGGFSIIGGVFGESINTSFRLRFIFAALLVCFILFNILSVLISSLFKLSANKSFAIQCKKSKDCPCSEKCWLLLRLFRRYPLVVWVNAVLILGLVMTFLFWISS